MSIDLDDIERRMEGAVATLKTDLEACAPGAPAPACWSRLWSRPMASKCRLRRWAHLGAGAAHAVGAGLG